MLENICSLILTWPLSYSFTSIQIIKNSDLEELRELGSGTFGTVYHGKWRGTDVAIKRINDRCFAGKPSEQERMVGHLLMQQYALIISFISCLTCIVILVTFDLLER